MTTLDTAPSTGADTFARFAMITCAVVSPLVVALTLVIDPIKATAEGEPLVKDFAAHLDSFSTSSYLSLLSAVTLIPAIFAISKVGRAGKPVLGLVGMILAFILVIPFTPDSSSTIYAALKSGLDTQATAKLLDTMENGLPTSVFGFTFFPGLLGIVLLGVAALLGKSAPAWSAILLLVAPFLIPVAWLAGLSNLVAAVAWLVMTAAMGSVALALPKPTS
ncbi:hypothetical protein [Nonomuraea sediminis]|uniref:hypothetical protein n=1 Tax=Nonomuraea sediminis TaxID=2835864 RepID=UPI001BDD9C4F|nr:hypothetical protein [Nonomuraea sediminis]